MRRLPGLALLVSCATSFAAERINQEGRILGPAPVVAQPTLFNTAQADAVVSAMQIMPVTSAWNEDVSRLPLLSNSAAMIARIASDLSASRRSLAPEFEMNYVLAPNSQPVQPISFFNYPDESDLNGGVSPIGLYPIPPDLPIETWPLETGALTLSQWQQDVTNVGGDRHSITVQPEAGALWETWETQLASGAWQASNGARFDLNSNALRPAGWTSGDAAGLPMFPALVRYDECERGMVEHAVRLVVKRTRVGPIYPATHQTGSLSDPNVPAMGQRLRLKSSFVVPASWTLEEKAVCLGLKKYGGIVADNGSFFSFSICPDDRFPPSAFSDLSSIAIGQFEVMQSTGPSEGPRSPGAPSVSAGPGQTIQFGATASLHGSAIAPSFPPAIQWKVASGPGAVTFGNASQAATTASFALPGVYILLLSANDGVHATAFDAITIQVALPIACEAVSGSFLVSFPSEAGHTYRVQRSADLSSGTWTAIADNLPGTGASLTVSDNNAFTHTQQFYRVEVLK